MARFARIEAAFSAKLLDDKKSLGNPSPVPVFIIGMPRSGTSLVEQILASHPGVFGAGERYELGDLAQAIARTRRRRISGGCRRHVGRSA